MIRSRRWVLSRGLAGTAAVATGLLPQGALAQSARSLFGVRLPDDVEGLLPADARDMLALAQEVIALERQADLNNLPRSALELARGQALPTSLDDLYGAALPRLVALIDRATLSRADGGLGDRAGELLARLHSGEHEIPEALQPHRAEQAGRTGAVKTGASADRNAARLWRAQFSAEPLVTVSEPLVQALPDPLPPEVSPPATPAKPPAAPGTPSRSIRYDDLADEYLAWFAALAVRPERRETAQWHATMLRQSRSRYEAVSARTQVPWYFIGATHGLEASFNFRGHLHNGDYPLSQRTRQIPANRPTVWLPPSDWESSAVDALRMMGFANQRDWSLARTLHRLEAYNGFGYRRRGVVTPYLWSFSDHYVSGKFVADGRYSATARSQQCGAAVMLKLLAEAGDVDLA